MINTQLFICAFCRIDEPSLFQLTFIAYLLSWYLQVRVRFSARIRFRLCLLEACYCFVYKKSVSQISFELFYILSLLGIQQLSIRHWFFLIFEGRISYRIYAIHIRLTQLEYSVIVVPVCSFIQTNFFKLEEMVNELRNEPVMCFKE